MTGGVNSKSAAMAGTAPGSPPARGGGSRRAAGIRAPPVSQPSLRSEKTAVWRHSRSLVVGWPSLVLKNPSRGQCPVPKRPGVRAMPDLLSQCSRGNAEHRALGVCHAVAAHPAGNRPCQRPTTASAHDQQVTAATGETYQDPACRAAFHMRLHHRIIRNFTPHCDERIPQTLPGHLLPDLAQIARRTKPWAGTITLRRHPRDNGHQHRIMSAGHNLRIAQCPQAARRASRPDDDATYTSHDAAPSPSPGGHVPATAHLGGHAVPAPTAPTRKRPRSGPASRCGQPVARQATECRPGITPDRDAPTEAFWPLIVHPWRTNPNLTNVCRPGFPAHLHTN